MAIYSGNEQQLLVTSDWQQQLETSGINGHGGSANEFWVSRKILRSQISKKNS